MPLDQVAPYQLKGDQTHWYFANVLRVNSVGRTLNPYQASTFKERPTTRTHSVVSLCKILNPARRLGNTHDLYRINKERWVRRFVGETEVTEVKHISHSNFGFLFRVKVDLGESPVSLDVKQGQITRANKS